MATRSFLAHWALSSAHSLLILSQLGRIKLLDRCEIGQWAAK